MSLARLNYRDCLFSAFPSRESLNGAGRRCADTGRERVETYIRNAYREAYDATIEVDCPVLISVQDDSGAIVAAAGFRCAASGPLFLEQYTREPAETVMSRLSGRSVERSRIAEIGNLASSDGSITLLLFSELATRLQQIGITHVIVTVTEGLHHRFIRLGLHPSKVCDATADLLVANVEDWGTYYDTRPRVLAGSLEEAVERLRTIPAVIRDTSRPLSIRLHGETGHE